MSDQHVGNAYRDSRSHQKEGLVDLRSEIARRLLGGCEWLDGINREPIELSQCEADFQLA